MEPTPTTKDVARAVATLNEFATYRKGQQVDHDYRGQTINDIAARVADEFAYMLRRHPAHYRQNTTGDVRAMLIVTGATPYVVNRYARQIAAELQQKIGGK